MAILEEDLKNLCGLSREVMFVASREQGILAVNRELEALLGFSESELAGRRIGEIVYPDDRDETETALRTSAIGLPFAIENRWATRSGEWRLISWVLECTPERIYGAGQDITAERAAEQALGHSAAELKLITDRLPALVSYLDTDGRYAQVNETYASWFGMDVERMIGLRAQDVLTERFGRDYWEQLRPCLDRALAGTPCRTEAHALYPAGERYFEVHYQPHFDANGRVRGVIALVIDMTNRKFAEIDLAFRAALLDNALEPIFAWSPGGEIIYWNPKAEKIYGYRREEAMGSRSHDLLKSVLPLPQDQFDAHLAETGEWRGELRHTTKSGELLTVESRMRVMELAGRRVVVESNRDVTARRAAELELRESEERYRFTVELSGQIVWTADAQGAVEAFSELAYELTGATPEESLGVGWFHLLHAEDKASTKTAWRAAVESGTAFDVEHRIRMRDGSYRWMRSRSFPRRGATGEIIRWYGTTEDIDGRKRAELTIAELNRDLERRVEVRTRELADINKELETFAYSVSHDLRAPLRAIDGFSRILLEDEAQRLSEAGVRCLDRIRANAQRMGELIEDLLQLSRVGRQPIEPRKIDLTSIAREVVENLRRQEPGRSAEVRIEPGMVAFGDARLIRIVLENLLGNAWKYTGKKAEASIEFERARAADGAAWVVRDNGAGFDPAYSHRLFAPFQRLHRDTEFPGTGIGLATVARIIRRHGGRVWAESEQEKGAAFYFTLGGDIAESGA